MGILFGLSAPICAAPLFLALLGQVGVAGMGKGFLSLSLFGLALSALFLVLAASKRASDLLSRVGRHAPRMTLVAGVVLILLGLWSVVIGWKGLPVWGRGGGAAGAGLDLDDERDVGLLSRSCLQAQYHFS